MEASHVERGSRSIQCLELVTSEKRKCTYRSFILKCCRFHRCPVATEEKSIEHSHDRSEAMYSTPGGLRCGLEISRVFGNGWGLLHVEKHGGVGKACGPNCNSVEPCLDVRWAEFNNEWKSHLKVHSAWRV